MYFVIYKTDLSRYEEDGMRYRNVEEMEEGTPDGTMAQTGTEKNNNISGVHGDQYGQCWL
jgi:hypothetical protein